MAKKVTGKQKRALVAKLLMVDPKASNRAVASATGVHHETVAAVRRQLEDGGEIRHHSKRLGADGVEQPASRKGAEVPAVLLVDPLSIDPRQILAGIAVDASAPAAARVAACKTLLALKEAPADELLEGIPRDALTRKALALLSETQMTEKAN